MRVQATSTYGLGTTLSLSFPDAVDRVLEVFVREGFKTVGEISVQKTQVEPSGSLIQPYTVIGFCHARINDEAIDKEPEIGLLLPFQVLIRSCDDGVHVSAKDPMLMLQLTQNEELRPVVEGARGRIESALQRLADG